MQTGRKNRTLWKAVRLVTALTLVISLLTGGFALATAPAGDPPSGGAPGGGTSQPESYTAVYTYAEDTALDGQTITSTGTDESAVLVTGGNVTLTNSTVTRTTTDSTGGDLASFYGVGAALLATGGTLTVDNTSIVTEGAGAAGAFSYGDGVITITNSTISTTGNTAGGIHVAGGGTLYAKNLLVTTLGESAAAIRSDRGSGTMVVDGGTYTSNGSGSPAVYVTADISINNAALKATGSEALCLEGLNSVALYNTSLTGAMPDQETNDNTWTVILYQSMSGDSEVGKGTFTMDGGSLTSTNGGLFYTTNTESEFVLRNVAIQAAEDSEYFLRATGNSNQRGWGTAGANGADTTFTAIDQTMAGNVIWDSISNLTFYMTGTSTLTGAIVQDETHAGDGGDGTATLVLAKGSTWVVTGDSVLTTLHTAGTIVDASQATVTVKGTDGTVYVQGDSQYTITVTNFDTTADTSSAGTIGEFSYPA